VIDPRRGRFDTSRQAPISMFGVEQETAVYDSQAGTQHINRVLRFYNLHSLQQDLLTKCRQPMNPPGIAALTAHPCQTSVILTSLPATSLPLRRSGMLCKETTAYLAGRPAPNFLAPDLASGRSLRSTTFVGELTTSMS
jgi:hypothetical protein